MALIATNEIRSRLAAASGFVFDKDGTLIDIHARWGPWIRDLARLIASEFGDDLVAAEVEMLLGLEGDRLAAESIAAVGTGSDIRNSVIVLMAERGYDVIAATEAVNTVYQRAVSGRLRPLGDPAATMRFLAARRRRLAVATSDDRANARSELEELGVLDLLGALRCGDDGGAVKPDPAVLAGVAEELGLQVNRLVFVGDSQHDLATARAAAIPFVAVLGGSSDAATLRRTSDAVVTTIDDLRDLFEAR
jgi:phosphoglycolate phosphatase